MLLLPIILSSVLLATILRYLIWYITTFRKALQLENSTPLPSVRIYTPRYSPFIYIISPYLAPLFTHLPFGWGKWMRYAVRDCTWNHKGTLPREELGSDVYWLLGPGGPQLWISDADLISNITHRWKDFPKPVMYYVQLLLFGENVVTAEGPTWLRHRKITARSFNAQNNSLVFTEAQEQAEGMLRSWSKQQNKENEKGERGSNPDSSSLKIVVNNLENSVTQLALSVISAAGFGHKLQWSGHEQTDPGAERPEITFADSLKTFVDEIFVLFIFPSWFLRLSPSAHLRNIHKAPGTFAKHVKEATEQARLGEKRENKKNDLLSNMANNRSPNSDSDPGLSDQEIIGNVFIFTLAGHETTATTIQTALILLALHPDLQQEIHEELDLIYASKSEGREGPLVYESDYPQMRRVMSLMFETLRLFPAISGIPKWTSSTPQVAHYNGQPFDIPADTSILLDVIAVHRNPRYWGEDAQDFRPSRWLMDDGYQPPANSVSHSKHHKNMLCPRKGAFIPFSEGYRDCLGKGFAQAEFCAVVATLLKDHSVELVPAKLEGGMAGSEDLWRTTCERAWKALDDRRNLTSFKMYGKVGVRFVPRGTE